MQDPLTGESAAAYDNSIWAQSCQEPHRFNERFQGIANRR